MVRAHPRPRRRGARRADDRERVRRRERHPHGAARHHAQPVAARHARPAAAPAAPRRRSPVASCTLATGGDGGGSIRIPAGFTGLVGLKSTIGRIPRGPWAPYGNLTVTIGCLSAARVRDTARWFDVCQRLRRPRPAEPAAGRGLGGRARHAPRRRCAARASRSRRLGAMPSVSPVMWELLEAAGCRLVAERGMQRVDGIDVALPRMGAAWSLSGNIAHRGRSSKDHWPAVRRRPHARDPLRRWRTSSASTTRGAGEDRAPADGGQRGDGAHLRPRRRRRLRDHRQQPRRRVRRRRPVARRVRRHRRRARATTAG